MSKPKKLSLEQKRSLLLDWFHEKKDVFLLKDVERLASKDKGISLPTVKEVLTSLTGDDLVDTDKIGLSVYFWAFPSKAHNALCQKIKKQKQTISELEAKQKQLDDEIEKLTKESKEDEEEMKLRTQLNEQIEAMKTEVVDCEESWTRLKDLDPEALESLTGNLQVARESVERWTDNIFSIRSWVKDNYFLSDAEIAKSLGIPEDFDYYEEEK